MDKFGDIFEVNVVDNLGEILGTILETKLGKFPGQFQEQFWEQFRNNNIYLYTENTMTNSFFGSIIDQANFAQNLG